MEKKIIFSINSAEIQKTKINLYFYFILYMNILVKYVKDVNMNSKTIKPEENKGKCLFNISQANIFLDKTQKAVNLKQKIRTFEFFKLKTAHQKISFKNVQVNHKLGQNVYNKYANTKALDLEYTYKGLLKFNNKRKQNPIFKI